jgi:hypothetical protein
MVLSKMTLATFAIGAAAFTTPVSSAPLAPPSKGPALRLQLDHHHHRHRGQSHRRILLFPRHAQAPDRHGHGHGQAHQLYGVPFSYGSYDNATECHWLRRRALDTGSSDWWDRFYACLYVYGYN